MRTDLADGNTGNAVKMFGATQNSGAPFSFAVDGSVKTCTCFQTETNFTGFQQTLCSVSGLELGKHTLIITHTGAQGTWLNLDQLE